MSNEEWIEVYRAKNAFQAQLFCEALEAAGVPALVEGDLAANVGIQLGWNTDPRILAPPEKADEAKALLKEMESQELGNAGLDENWEDQAENTPEA